MYTDIKLTEISESSGKIERVFNGNIAQLKTLDVTLDINCERPCSGCYKDYWLAEVKENE